MRQYKKRFFIALLVFLGLAIGLFVFYIVADAIGFRSGNFCIKNEGIRTKNPSESLFGGWKL
jgi:hypothetical protein